MARPAVIASIGMFAFAVPPYSRDYRLSIDAPAEQLWGMPNGGTVWGLTPHLHARGRSLSVMRTRGSERTCLIRRAALGRSLARVFSLSNPEGMRVEPSDQTHLSCSWDNPSSDTVNYGATAGDEMCLSYLYVTD